MTFSTIEPARAGVASEIRYSHVTHGYHLFSPTGEMLGNPYGYESYLEAERADSGRCLTCGQPTEGVICATCADTGHRCSQGHALEDTGECETCADIEDADQARLRDAEADEAEPRGPDPLDLIAYDVGGVVAHVNGKKTIIVPDDYETEFYSDYDAWM